MLFVLAIIQLYYLRADTNIRCSACDGTGKINVFVKSSDSKPAPERVGRVQQMKYIGYSYDGSCDKCDGAGKITN